MSCKIQSLSVGVVTALFVCLFTSGVSSATVLSSSEGSSSLSSGTSHAMEGPAFEKIYRNSQGFSHLVAPRVLSPRVAITNQDTGKVCSAGWFFEKGDQILLSTAGHCGSQGDRFSFTNQDGETVSIGKIVVSDYQTTSDLGISDFALIEVIDLSVVGSTVPLENRYLPVEMTYEDAPSASFTRFDFICGLGFRSGLSCGPFDSIGEKGELFFRRISDTGDSGGPVFGVNGSTIVPLALGSAGSNDDATKSLNQPILSKMRQYNLKLHL